MPENVAHVLAANPARMPSEIGASSPMRPRRKSRHADEKNGPPVHLKYLVLLRDTLLRGPDSWLTLAAYVRSGEDIQLEVHPVLQLGIEKRASEAELGLDLDAKPGMPKHSEQLVQPLLLVRERMILHEECINVRQAIRAIQ